MASGGLTSGDPSGDWDMDLGDICLDVSPSDAIHPATIIALGDNDWEMDLGEISLRIQTFVNIP